MELAGMIILCCLVLLFVSKTFRTFVLLLIVGLWFVYHFSH